MGSDSKFPRIVLWLAAACLFAAILVSMLSLRGEEQSVRVKLSVALPKKINGWVGEDLPLGDTEVTNATTRLLNYDDYIYRVYRRGGVEVYLYAMYWKQGSISVREIAGHTPDGCWVSNGATPIGRSTAEALTVGSRPTVAAEVRQFAFQNGERVNVAWWHLWGDNLVDRGFDQKTLFPTLRELWVWLGQRHGARRDQLLVRIHTAGDLGQAIAAEPVVSFLGNFPEVFTAQSL